MSNSEDHPFIERFRNILSDPLNNLIERIEGAGNIIGDHLIMYNGIKILPDSYFGKFSDIFKINGGVHEPQEEFLFVDVIKKFNSSPEELTMIELGSYWSFYSMSFLKENPGARCIMIETEDSFIEVGKKHFSLNGMTGEFIKGKISEQDIRIDDLISSKKIDRINILHSDIQGYEIDMLKGSKKSMEKRLIDFFFISTHSQEIHLECLDLLKESDYKIIGSADFDNESFCHDGVIVSCSKDIDYPIVDLGNKSKTKLKDISLVRDLLKNKDL